MTVPVELEDERDASEFFETGWRGASVGFAAPYRLALSSVGEMLGSCTVSLDTRLVVLPLPSSIAKKLVLVSGPGVVPGLGV